MDPEFRQRFPRWLLLEVRVGAHCGAARRALTSHRTVMRSLELQHSPQRLWVSAMDRGLSLREQASESGVGDICAWRTPRGDPRGARAKRWDDRAPRSPAGLP